MKKILDCFGLSAVLGMLLFTYAWAEPQKISIEVLAVEIPAASFSEFVSFQGPSPEIDADKIRKSFSSPAKTEKINLILNKSIVTFEGGKKTRESVQSLPFSAKTEGFNLLVKEKIIAVEGKKASFSNYRDVLYMEKTGEGIFKLKKLTGKEGAGISVEVFPTLTKDGKINAECKVSIREVIKSVPVEGAETLDVGLPLFSVRENSSSVILDGDRPQTIEIDIYSKTKPYLNLTDSSLTDGWKSRVGVSGPYYLVIITAQKGGV